MRNILLLSVVIVALPVCLVRPWIGILVWDWLGFMNPHRLAWGFVKDLPLAQMVAIATLLGILMTNDRKAVPWSKEMILMLAVFAYFTLTTFFAWVPDEAWIQWDKVMKIIAASFVTTMLIYGKKRIHALLLVLALSIGFYGAKGGIFTILHGGVHRIYGPEGTFIGGNTAIGLAMIMVLPLLIFLGREESRRWLRNATYAVAALTFISIIFTYSRGALIGLAAILPFLFMKSRKKFLVFILLPPLLLVGKGLVPEKLYTRAESIQDYQEDGSAMQRLQAWGVAYNIAKQHPFTGAGFNFYYISDEEWLSYANFLVQMADNEARAAHSIYFQVLGQHGFIGFGLFLAMILATMLSLRKVRIQAEQTPDTVWIANYASAIQIGLIGYLTAGAFLSLAYFDLLYTFIVLTAILSREVRLADVDEARTKGRGVELGAATHQLTEQPRRRESTTTLRGSE